MKMAWIVIAAAFCVLFTGVIVMYGINAYNTAYALGTEVETTEEYADIFGDSFSGHIIYRTSYWARAITVRNADGVERVFAAEWLEPVEATPIPTHK